MTDVAVVDNSIELAELRSLVSRMESLLAVGAPRAAMDADGFPGTVAAGELIESAWGNATSSKLKIAPRGYKHRYLMPSASAGFGTTEFVIAGMTWTLPAVTGRIYNVRYGLCVIPTTAPGAPSAILTVTGRTGSTTAGAAYGANQHNFQSGDRGFDARPNLFGEFAVGGFASAAQQCLTFTASAGVYTLGATSWVYVEDVGV